MLKEHRHLKIQRRMRIEMALNELNVCYHAEPEDASDLWTSGVVCPQVGTNYPSLQIKSQVEIWGFPDLHADLIYSITSRPPLCAGLEQ